MQQDMIVDIYRDKCKAEANERISIDKSNTLLIQTNEKLCSLEIRQKEIEEKLALSKIQVSHY